MTQTVNIFYCIRIYLQNISSTHTMAIYLYNHTYLSILYRWCTSRLRFPSSCSLFCWCVAWRCRGRPKGFKFYLYPDLDRLKDPEVGVPVHACSPAMLACYTLASTSTEICFKITGINRSWSYFHRKRCHSNSHPYSTYLYLFILLSCTFCCGNQIKVTRFLRQNPGTFSVQRCKNLQTCSVFVIEKQKRGHCPYHSQSSFSHSIYPQKTSLIKVVNSSWDQEHP